MCNSPSQSESSLVCFLLGMVLITVKETMWVSLTAGVCWIDIAAVHLEDKAILTQFTNGSINTNKPFTTS